MSSAFSAENLEFFGRVLREGALLSSQRMSAFLGERWKVSISGTRALSLERLPALHKPDNMTHIGAAISIRDPIPLDVVLLFPDWSLAPVMEALTRAAPKLREDSQLEQMAAGETANILGNGILRALGDRCGRLLIASAPLVVRGTKEEVLSEFLKRMPPASQGLFSQAEFYSDRQAAAATLVLLTDAAAMSALLGPVQTPSEPKAGSDANEAPPAPAVVTVRADTPSERDEVFRLRYKVYCLECKFEKIEDHPGEIERDAYDDHSIHFLTRDAHGRAIGTARLVLDSPLGFPMEKECDMSEAFAGIDRRGVAEFSRFAISKGVRNDDRETAAAPSATRAGHSEIALSLILALAKESKARGIAHWCAAIERVLWLALRHGEMGLRQVGPPVDYHGVRIPCLSSLEEFVDAKLFPFPPNILAFFGDAARPKNMSD